MTNRRAKWTGILLTSILAICSRGLAAGAAATEPSAAALVALRKNINHIIVIYQENWSFDGLYGKFPGANGLGNAGNAVKQVDRAGRPYAGLPPIKDTRRNAADQDDARITAGELPMEPLDLLRFISPSEKTGDAVHRFYENQYQIDGGKNDKYVAYSDAGGLTMTYYDATNLPEGKLAQEFTLCDDFFQGAFGGSFLNHFWFIAAAGPVFPNAPEKYVEKLDAAGNPTNFGSCFVTADGYAINTLYSISKPIKPGEPVDRLLPLQKFPTIGESLSGRHISWAWYGGGWDNAVAGHPAADFAYNHQPFAYFEKYAEGTPGRAEHLKDEKDFLAALKTEALPAVCYIKPAAGSDAHPGDSALLPSMEHEADLVAAIRNSAYWKDSVIIITYDENGGRWDHVAPPKGDRFGPSTRIPALVVSPFAKKHFVDHTQYDSTSILKLIELRFDLAPLTPRDTAADGMLNSLSFGP